MELSKADWEKQAAEVFIEWHNQHFVKQLQFISNNRPAKPDVSCLLDGNRIDLEIAHLYGTQQDAMTILGKDLSEHMKNELARLQANSTVEQRLILALNRILEQKAHKRYNSQNVWLVIRNVHPHWNAEKILAASSGINLPKEHIFTQIWIIGDLTAASGALRIKHT
jgi:hypothetical protein